MIPNNIWNAVAQISHTLGGLCLVAYTVIIFGPHGLFYSVPIFIFLTAIKEFWFDENYETADERGSNLRDFLFYCGGLALGILVCWVAGKL